MTIDPNDTWVCPKCGKDSGYLARGNPATCFDCNLIMVRNPGMTTPTPDAGHVYDESDCLDVILKMIGQMDDLRKENDKLRAERDKWQSAFDECESFDAPVELQKERTKVSELTAERDTARRDLAVAVEELAVRKGSKD